MAQPHIIAHRGRVTIDADWLEPVVRALESGTPLEPDASMSGGTHRLAEFVTQHAGPDSRYAPLARVPERPREQNRRRSTGFVLMIGNTPTQPDNDDIDPLITPSDYVPAYAESWQFDRSMDERGHRP